MLLVRDSRSTATHCLSLAITHGTCHVRHRVQHLASCHVYCLPVCTLQDITQTRSLTVVHVLLLIGTKNLKHTIHYPVLTSLFPALRNVQPAYIGRLQRWKPQILPLPNSPSLFSHLSFVRFIIVSLHLQSMSLLSSWLATLMLPHLEILPPQELPPGLSWSL